jgi:selenocysteine lyase/cysteine desulfurase
VFPVTAARAYFNTAAVGLASRRLADAYHAFVEEWAKTGLDYRRGEQAADKARSAVARQLGANASDIALIPSVSSAAGLVAAQLGRAGLGDNVVIGEKEYSSNHFPWRQLAGKGYDVRQVAFRNGGLEPEDVSECVDAGTRLVAFSGVQSATGHRSDITAISGLAHNVGAVVFVDGTQLLGALPVGRDLQHVDVLAASDHKFLLNAGRGMGYCYPSPVVQQRFTPINAGWKAGAVLLESFFGPQMKLSATASRFAAPSAGWPPSATKRRSRSSTSSGPAPSTPATARSPQSSEPPWPAPGGTRLTCPNRTRARSSASRLAAANQRGFSAHCPTRESCAPHAMATCAYPSISTTMKMTSTGW